MKTINDKTIKLVKEGDELAFRKVINAYRKYLFAMCYSATNNFEQARDLLVEVFEKIWNKIDLYNDNTEKFKEWATTLARNHIRDYLRKNKNVELIDQNNFINELTQSIEIDRDLWYDIERMLTPLQYEVIKNKIYKKFSFKEIATLLNIKIKKCKYTYYTALQIIRKAHEGEKK